jgi:hypothetical protein
MSRRGAGFLVLTHNLTFMPLASRQRYVTFNLDLEYVNHAQAVGGPTVHLGGPTPRRRQVSLHRIKFGGIREKQCVYTNS